LRTTTSYRCRSTWLEDEEEIDHFANTNPNIGSSLRLMKLMRKIARNRRIVRDVYTVFGITTGDGRENTPNVLIIDNIGLLSRLYHYATIAYVGGGFGDDGVHNVLEAAVYGKPVVSDLYYDRYIEAVELVGSGVDSQLKMHWKRKNFSSTNR
jgi:3-deoxy-D-manno-octulosonic-acid transferase